MTVQNDQVAPRRPILLYDGSCGFCRRCVALLVRLDTERRVARVDMTSRTAESLMSTISPSRRHQSLHVIRPDGRVLHAGLALRAVLCQVQPDASWRSAGYWPFVGTLIDRLYDLVAALRGPLGRITGWLPEPPSDDLLPSDWPLLDRPESGDTRQRDPTT
jgi:predicted DCC family thiol-disulfide oxidoreductase YuxK